MSFRMRVGAAGLGFLFSWSLFLALGASCAQAEKKSEGQVSPRPTMRVVFKEMRELIPLSLSKERWSEPSARPKVLASLERLEMAASALESHSRSREAGFQELAINLGGDFYEALNGCFAEDERVALSRIPDRDAIVDSIKVLLGKGR